MVPDAIPPEAALNMLYRAASFAVCMYLFSCPPCFAKVAFPCLGQRSIIIMFIHLSLFLILLTTVNTADTQREKGNLKNKWRRCEKIISK